MSVYVKSIASDSVTLTVHKGKGYQRGCHILVGCYRPHSPQMFFCRKSPQLSGYAGFSKYRA